MHNYKNLNINKMSLQIKPHGSPQTIQAIANVIGCPLQTDDKAL